MFHYERLEQQQGLSELRGMSRELSEHGRKKNDTAGTASPMFG